jgi:uncharacterized delta-60 repeat protein
MSSSKTPSENLHPDEKGRETPASAQGSMRRVGRRLLLAACLLAVLLIPAAQATPGALDPSFGAGGKVTTAIGAADAHAYALVRQPDGKLVVAGDSFNITTPSLYDFTLARYNPNGSLDTSFNGTGKVTTAIGLNNDSASALALQPNGKLVAAGYSYNGFNYDFALARYNADGSLDTSLDSDGIVTTPFAVYDDLAYAVAVQPDGKIIAAGRSSNGSNYDFALARYNPNGSLDTSFNGTGKVTTAIGSDHDEAYALALQPDGKLVAAGLSRTGSGAVFALARYNPNGSLDTSFGSGGKVTTAIGIQDDAIALAQQPDGKLVAAGYSYNPQRVFALARYNPNGSLDTSFNGTGKVTTAIGSFDDEAYALALQPDGKLVAAGFSYNGSNNVFALVRYLGSTLTVAKTGSGSGSVTSSPSGIDCGSTCSAPFAAIPVTLTATAAGGSSFTGWSGDCSGTGSCTLTMSADQAATASFETDKTLTLTKAGGGTGTVTSSPAGISCGSTCAHAFTHGTAVTLTGVASARSRFAGWSGACSGSGSCTLTMSAARSVTATFKVLCVVPKVKGKKLRAAKRAIRHAHCSVGKVTRVFSARVKKGRVISSKPKPGAKRPPGSKVKLKVSKGKKT